MSTNILQRQAAFAVISRLLSCLVTERILRAYYVSLVDASPARGIVVILSTHSISEQPTINRPLHVCDVLAIVPVYHAPVFQGHSVSSHGRPVALLDPLDMLQEIYELSEASDEKVDVSKLPLSLHPGEFLLTEQGGIKHKILNSLSPPSWKVQHSASLKSCHNPARIWSKFVEGIVLPDNLRVVIAKELQSSYDWQCLSCHFAVKLR